MQRGIALRCHKPAIDYNIAQLHQLAANRVLQQILKSVTRIAPYGFIGLSFNPSRQLDKTLGMQHWVTTRKSYIHIGINYALKQLFDRYSHSSIFVPRLGIVTPFAVVFTPCTIERSAKAYTVNRSAILDI
jgi:hypothetical protein